MVGKRPWEVSADEVVIALRRNIAKLFNTRSEHSFATAWVSSLNPDVRYHYWTHGQWVGEPDVAASLQVWELPPGVEKLSKQQRKIMAMMSNGKRVSEVASILGISQSTVRTHIDAIKVKTCTSSMTEVIVTGVHCTKARGWFD